MRKTKLHLGCGQRYIKGYVNIDFPSSQHTVQSSSVADIHYDITKLRYSANSISEVRLHHVFEHFDRATVCALLLTWHSWLIPNGLLRIEVPDFYKTAFMVLNPFTKENVKNVALRHIFGSQEAPWAYHYHGWTKSNIQKMLSLLGYKVLKITSNSWNYTYNIEIFAIKHKETLDISHADKIVKTILSNFLVDNSKSELEMLDIWMNTYRMQMNKTFIKTLKK